MPPPNLLVRHIRNMQSVRQIPSVLIPLRSEVADRKNSGPQLACNVRDLRKPIWIRLILLFNRHQITSNSNGNFTRALQRPKPESRSNLIYPFFKNPLRSCILLFFLHFSSVFRTSDLLGPYPNPSSSFLLSPSARRPIKNRLAQNLTANSR
jgi:hypothetical protein